VAADLPVSATRNQAPRSACLEPSGGRTSIENIGFLDGAVETGEAAAKQLLKYVKKHHH
jgi:hypothetical protein